MRICVHVSVCVCVYVCVSVCSLCCRRHLVNTRRKFVDILCAGYVLGEGRGGRERGGLSRAVPVAVLAPNPLRGAGVLADVAKDVFLVCLRVSFHLRSGVEVERVVGVGVRQELGQVHVKEVPEREGGHPGLV